MKDKLKVFLKITVSVVLIYILVKSADIPKLVDYFKTFNLVYVLPVFLCIVLNYVVSSVRWKQLLIYKNTEHVSLWFLVKLYFIGSFFNNFMPTSIGGDVYKVFRLSKVIGSTENAFSATFMERFTGVISLVFISLFGFLVSLLGENTQSDLTLIILISTLGLGFCLIIGIIVGLKLLEFIKTRTSKFTKFYDSLVMYKGHKKVLIQAFLSSFIVQFLSIFSQYFIIKGLGYSPDIFKSLFIFPVITLASFFIPSLNGIGVQDFLYKFSTDYLLLSASGALAASFLYHIFRLAVSLIGGLLYASERSK